MCGKAAHTGTSPFWKSVGRVTKVYSGHVGNQVLNICENTQCVGCSDLLLLGTQSPTSSPRE